ncbi:MAG: threonylcarbamoyl-AMP synthase [Candidatus Magasanikbacteria bacterium]|nr:threonylcarbamoyl-AMP synthase [Candidatus Magasanikbacteria bacterium]
MQTIKQSDLDISALTEKLKSGSTIVYPTETCYGLGCDARNSLAVEKIIKIKQRKEKKPFLVVVPDAAMALRYLEWSQKLQELADKYWFTWRSFSGDGPGALTVVARAKEDCGLAPGVVAPDGTVAFRVTSHPLAARLSRELGAPIVSTSANISGQSQSYSAEAVRQSFANQPNQPDIIIDVGELPHRAPSTIVRVLDGKVEVLRQGETVINL